MKRLLLIFFIFLLAEFFYPAQAAVAGSDPIVRLFPNPATSVINLDLGKALNRGYSVQVFSFLGRKMYETTNINQRLSLNLTDYNRGVYIYQLRDRSGKLVESGKFQVSK